MPVGQGPLSWPFPPREQDYVHQPDEQYDAQMHHFVYNKTWLLSKFPPDTPYISIIRQPYSHLKSEFNYFRFPHLLDIHSENPLKTFLTNPWMYRNKSEIFFPHVNVSWDGTRNPLTFDLGWPAEKADNEEDARSYINQIETEFTLVMILEHLAESLVLLRRLLCWNIKDVVLYARKENERAYSFKKYVATPEEMQNHRRWAAVDYMLYDTFNKSLWRKIYSQGPDFYSEVEYFKRICGVISDYCNKTMEERMDRSKKNLTEVKMVVKASQWSPEFDVDRTYCSYITSVKVYAMDVKMRGRPYTKDEMSRKMMDQNANIPLMRRGLPSFFTRYEARLAGIDV
ncbi:hypothetical protein Bbelb_011450 [Branchiostoma belcheri]|nr:hypothetical protein Bbelb_011450 [Branchiostoma belcheri]